MMMTISKSHLGSETKNFQIYFILVSHIHRPLGRFTVVVVSVPLHIGDQAAHVHRAEEARPVPHLQAEVLRGGENVRQAAHLH